MTSSPRRRPNVRAQVLKHSGDPIAQLAHEMIGYEIGHRRRGSSEYRYYEQLALRDGDGDVATVECERQDLACKQPRCNVVALEPVHHQRSERQRLVFLDRSGTRD